MRLAASGAAPGPLDPQIIAPDLETAYYNVYEEFTGRDRRFQPTNVLVEQWEPNKDASVWTAHLRRGVEFHDGKTFDADDFIYSVNRILDPRTGAAGIVAFGAVARMRKRDAHTVEFTMNGPSGAFPTTLPNTRTAVVPKGFDPTKPNGTGPYRVVKYVPGQSATLERFDNYWGEKALLDRIEITFIADGTARANALLSGQVDAVHRLDSSQVNQIKGHPGLRVLSGPCAQTGPIQLPVDHGVFKDLRVRQALRLAVDRQQTIDIGLGGLGTPAYDFYGLGDPAFDSSLKRERDVEQAKSLLKQAGQSDLRFELVVAPQASGLVETAQVFAQNCADAGVTVKVRQVDIGTFYSKPQWPSNVTSWPGFNILTIAQQADTSRGPYNRTRWTDAEFDAAYAKAYATLEESERTDQVQTMQQVLFERGSWVVPWFGYNIGATTDKVAGTNADDLTSYDFLVRDLSRMYFV
ncbi:MAG TPA: ABC transporter substrate-binding protein [Conexibacter sp.]|nr:ABC transporter substrate-binding protein [Conexibacter sp.]